MRLFVDGYRLTKENSKRVADFLNSIFSKPMNEEELKIFVYSNYILVEESQDEHYYRSESDYAITHPNLYYLRQKRKYFADYCIFNELPEISLGFNEDGVIAEETVIFPIKYKNM